MEGNVLSKSANLETSNLNICFFLIFENNNTYNTNNNTHNNNNN